MDFPKEERLINRNQAAFAAAQVYRWFEVPSHGSFDATTRYSTLTSLLPPYTKMSTLADELLNDFEDSGSEGEDEQKRSFLHEGISSPQADLVNGHGRQSGSSKLNGSMELDGDEEAISDPDEEMSNGDGLNGGDTLGDVNDEEEAKAKVEKMQLGGISDVRSVAGLMKTLEPVLQVGAPPPFHITLLLEVGVYIYFADTALTFRRPPTEYRPLSVFAS